MVVCDVCKKEISNNEETFHLSHEGKDVWEGMKLCSACGNEVWNALKEESKKHTVVMEKDPFSELWNC